MYIHTFQRIIGVGDEAAMGEVSTNVTCGKDE